MPATRTEPAIIVNALLGLLLAVGGYLTAIGQDIRWEIAAGAAVTAFATSLGAGALIRSQVYSPATADTIMDAHAVIEAAERRGTV